MDTLFESHDVKFNIIVSTRPEPIVSFLRDSWEALDHRFVIIAPDEVTLEAIEGQRVVCEERTLTLEQAAACEFVLELPPEEPESTVGYHAAVEKRLFSARRKRPYIREIADWAELQADREPFSETFDMTFIRKSMDRALVDAARKIGSTLARRIVLRHPDFENEDSPERRAYHADVFAAFKRAMRLCPDAPVAAEVASEVFDACEFAWLTKPFAPVWVRDIHGRFAVKAWRGRINESTPNVQFRTKNYEDFDIERCNVVPFSEVPREYADALEECFGRDYEEYRRFSDFDMRGYGPRE